MGEDFHRLRKKQHKYFHLSLDSPKGQRGQDQIPYTQYNDSGLPKNQQVRKRGYGLRDLQRREV